MATSCQNSQIAQMRKSDDSRSKYGYFSGLKDFLTRTLTPNAAQILTYLGLQAVNRSSFQQWII